MKILIRSGVALAIAAVTASAADAAVTFDVVQNDTGVVVKASGTFDASLATTIDRYNSQGPYFGNRPFDFATGGADFQLVYSLSTGNATYAGSSAYAGGSDVAGLGIGVDFFGKGFYLSRDYISNSRIASSAVFADQTLASLGVSVGTYSFTVGGNAGTVNVVGPITAAVPEPATWAMMLLGFGMVAGAARYRRRSLTAAIA